MGSGGIFAEEGRVGGRLGEAIGRRLAQLYWVGGGGWGGYLGILAHASHGHRDAVLFFLLTVVSRVSEYLCVLGIPRFRPFDPILCLIPYC